MEIKCGSNAIKGSNATVVLDSQDYLSVGYTDPNGKFHTVNITAQNLVLIVTHEQTDASMIFRPAVGVQFIEGTK